MSYIQYIISIHNILFNPAIVVKKINKTWITYDIKIKFTQGISLNMLRNDHYTHATWRGDVNIEKVQGDAKEQEWLVSNLYELETLLMQ